MHRRIDDVKVFLTQDDILINHSLLDSLQVVPVHLTTDDLNQVVVRLELHVLDLHLVHLLDDTYIVRSQHLCAVFPISLVAIIFAGVVRSCHVDTSLSVKLTDGKRDLWCRTKALEEISLDAVGREDGCYGLSEHTTVVTAVVTYYDSKILTTWECLQDIVGKSLGSHTHDVLVHTVRTSTHDTTEATSTKLKILIESVNQRSLVLCVEHCLNFLTCLLIKGRREPFFCPCLALSNQLCIVCHNYLFCSF